MNDIVAERSESILDVSFNRPAKKNALTMSMYATFATLLDDAAKDDGIHVVLVHGAGDAFTEGNDFGDFLKNPPAPDDRPQQRLIDALQPAGALQASKRLLKRSLREPLEEAAKAEIQEFASRVRSAEAREAFTAFFEKRRRETR